MLTHTLYKEARMFTEDSLKIQVDMITTMLEVSPYFDDVKVEVIANEETYTVFAFGDGKWIEVRYNNHGLHIYLPGHDNQVGGFGDEGPSIEEVYIGKCISLHQSVVKIVTRMYEDQLQAVMEQYSTKSQPDYSIFDEVQQA